jgi:hypothetical protein
MMVVMDNIELRLIQGEELAKMHGYSGVTSQCRAWWRSLGIKPVPGRKNIYDPRLVRDRLDQAGGLAVAKLINEPATVSLVDQRKARINAQR